MNNELEQSIREQMLNADHAARYWNAMAIRYVRRERNLKIFLAITASATVAGWSIWKGVPELWQALSIISAIVSIALPIIHVPRQVELMTEVCEGWHHLQRDCESLWVMRDSVSDADAQACLTKIAESHGKISKKSIKLPHDDKKLGAKVYFDVIRERGLQIPLKVDNNERN